MHIVAFFVALVAALSVAILYPRLRIPAGLLVAFFLGLMIYVFVQIPGETDQRDARITAEQLELDDVSLVQEARFSRLTGRVRNLSDTYTLRDFDVRVTLLDCPAPDAGAEACVVIAEDNGIARVNLPPGQVRRFEVVLRFTDVPEPTGYAEWDYQVTGIRASE